MTTAEVLKQIKARCGIPETVAVYDDEIKPLMTEGLEDMQTAGVPDGMVTPLHDLIVSGDETTSIGINGRVLHALALYVLTFHGQDRSDSTWYHDQYRRTLHKLMLEPVEDDADVDGTDTTQ